MIIQILGLAIVAVLFADWFKPIQVIKDHFKMYNIKYIGSMFYCSKCVGLWFGLAYFQALFPAAIVSLLAYIIKFVIDKIESWYE
jgi:hypothetical protein